LASAGVDTGGCSLAAVEAAGATGVAGFAGGVNTGGGGVYAVCEWWLQPASVNSAAQQRSVTVV
jgi:hypothetical protein